MVFSCLVIGCHGTGKITCTECHGAKQNRHFVEMTQHFATIHNERVVDMIPDNELPPSKLSSAPGGFLCNCCIMNNKLILFYIILDHRTFDLGREVLNHCCVNLAPPSGFNAMVDAALVEMDTSAQGSVAQKCGMLM